MIGSNPFGYDAVVEAPGPESILPVPEMRASVEKLRGPGITTSVRGYGFRARAAFASRPGMTETNVSSGRHFPSFTAITSISTRKPGLASAATPTTERAGKLGWSPPKNWV